MKQKLFTLLFAIVASIGSIFAYVAKIGDLYYILDSENLTAEVTLPDDNYSGLTSADIPPSVTYDNQTYSVTSIASWTFYCCSNLTSVTIPISMTSIGDGAFGFCSSLTSVTWNAKSCARAGYFDGPVETFTFGDEVESIPAYCCKGLKILTSIIIPNSVTRIGDGAFSHCSSLTSVTIPNGITSIGESTFEDCNSLNFVTIPNSVTSIGNKAFRSSGITSITIPDSVTSIGGYAFDGCSSLSSVTIGNNVTSIWGDAFNSCSNLTSITAPALAFDVTDAYWLQYPKHIENVCVTTGEMSENAFGFISRSYKTLLCVDLSAITNTKLADEAFKDFYNLQTLILPANLTRINYKAVAGCVNLKAIDIPASVEEIDQSAFEDCRSIETITFGGVQPSPAPGKNTSRATNANSQLRKIGNWAFYNAHELKHLEIPEGVEEIGDGAFYGCTYLTDIVLPASVRAIGDNCFALCGKLTQIVVNSPEPPQIQPKTFFDVNRRIPVYVPDDCIEAYESDALWGEFDIQGVSNIADALDVTNASSTQHKLLMGGQLFILREGKIYNVQGQEVR